VTGADSFAVEFGYQQDNHITLSLKSQERIGL